MADAVLPAAPDEGAPPPAGPDAAERRRDRDGRGAPRLVVEPSEGAADLRDPHGARGPAGRLVHEADLREVDPRAPAALARAGCGGRLARAVAAPPAVARVAASARAR